MSSFSDYFLIKAASQYVYEMSYSHVYKDPIFSIRMNINREFLNRYSIEKIRSRAFYRDKQSIDLRYLLIKDSVSGEYALIFQGSEGEITNMFSGEDNDWSNNLNSAAHLDLPNFDLAKAEYEHLVKEGYRITAVSGNSLGGGYALYIKDHYPKLKALGLNPAPREFSARFTKDENAIIVLTSKDILSRSLILDVKRYESENLNSITKMAFEDRIEAVYGLKPYIINRSLPYSSGHNITINHVGAMRNYRTKLLEVYKKNFIYYNAKIIRQHKEWKSFSKYLLQTAYKQLAQQEYRIFTEDYIYPSLSLNDQKIVDTYKLYPQMEEFNAFDLKTGNLINEVGKPLCTSSFKIENSFDFVNNAYRGLGFFMKTKVFLNDNSTAELLSLADNEGLTFSKKKFLSSTLKLSIDWDWAIAKIFVDMPLPVKLKTTELIEQNISFIYKLNNQLGSEYTLKEDFSDAEIDIYVEDLLEALKRLKSMNYDFEVSYKKMMSNVEMFLIEGKKHYTPELLEEIPLPKHYNFEDLKSLEKKIMHKHFEAAKKAIGSNKDYVEERVVDIAKTLKQILEVILEGLRLEKDKGEDPKINKLYRQTDALLNNIDLESFFVLALYEYQEDIVTYLLRDSVAIIVQYNLIQSLELNQNFNRHFLNLDLYMMENLNEKQYAHFLRDLKDVRSILELETKCIESVLK